MKKIIALLLAVVMVFALVACASTAKTEEKTDAPAPAETNNEQTTEPAEETDAPAEDETAEPAGDAVGTDIKIGVVLIGDENEGYTYSHIKGIQEAAKALGISESNIVWKYSIGEDETCYDACVDCVDQGCQIVITNSYGHQSFCLQAAEEYPDVQFVAMTGDTARANGLDNFHNAFTGIYQARYVGGVVAGMKLQQLIDEGKVEDKNKTADGKIKIGYVGAYPYAEVVSGYTAFFLGLQSIVPDVAMQVQYTNSWYDPVAEGEAANALMARFNYEERGQETLMVKPRLDTRDGDHMVSSRIGLTHPCIYFDEMRAMADEELQKYACIIIDEAQFLTKDEVFYLVHLVDDCGIPVLCYGLKVDFRGQLFEGSYYLLAMADKLEEVKTICWCGKKAAFNARFDSRGRVVKEGEQVVLGANDRYTSLCRRHWMAGDLGPDFHIRRT